ncbi:retrotransposon ORF1 [Tanacetum coccineum]
MIRRSNGVTNERSEVANEFSSIVSPSTPPGNDLNIAKESCSTWLDYVGPLITDELDSEKRWSYRDPKGNIQGSFSLAQITYSNGEWDTPEYHDTSDSGKKKEANAFTFYRMETEDISERYDAPCFVNGLEAYDGEINLEHDKNLISNEFMVKLCLEHEMKNGDKRYKKVLDTILLDKLKLDGELELEEVEANEEMIREYKAIKEKDDHDVFVLPIRLEGRFDTHALADTGPNINIIPYCIFEELGREHVKPVSHNVSRLNHSEAKLIGMLKDILCQVGVITVIARFLILDMPVDCIVAIIIERSFLHTCGGIINTLKGTTSTFDGVCHQKFYVAKIQNNGEESDSDDEEEYYLKRDEMGRPFYGPNIISYFDRNDPIELGTHDDEASSSRPKRTRQSETVEEVMLPRVYHEFLLWGTINRATKIRYNTNLAWLLPKQIYSPYVVDWGLLNNMGCAEEIEDMLEIKVYEIGGQQEIFTSEVWRRLFDINEKIYTELCHEFYSTYTFDEVCADDELRTNDMK